MGLVSRARQTLQGHKDQPDWCKHGVGFLLLQKHCKCGPKANGELNKLCCKDVWKVVMVGSKFTILLLAIWNGLEKTKYFTLGCPHLYIGTDHKPLLGLLNNSALEKIDNPRLIRLKEKTMGWVFKTIYIPGKMLGSTDALSRYGVRHKDGGTEEPEVSWEDIKLATANDPELQSMITAGNVSLSDRPGKSCKRCKRRLRTFC